MFLGGGILRKKGLRLRLLGRGGGGPLMCRLHRARGL